MRIPLLSIASVALLLSACTPSTVSLDYLPNVATNLRGQPIFAVGDFVDQRGMASNHIGGIGLPGIVNLENIYLKGGVDQSVRNAMLHALDARKMLASGQPRYAFTGDILDLHCELLKNPYAIVRLNVKMTDTHTGQVVHAKQYTAERQSTFFVHGSGDPVPILRNLTSRALQDAVDQAIDDPAMRRHIR
jgi:hypothetical protein